MSDFYDSPIFFYIMFAVLAAYSVYFLYSTGKYFHNNVKVRKKFRTEGKGEQIRSYNHYQTWAAVYSAFVIYCVYSLFTLDHRIEQYEWFWMAFLFVGVILFGQILICIVKRRAICSDKGFVYEDKIIQWRSVLNMEPKKKGLQRKIDVLTSTAGTLEMPVDLGKEMHEEHENYRKERKARREKK